MNENQPMLIDCSPILAMLLEGKAAGIQEAYRNKQNIQATALAILDIYRQSGGQSVPVWDSALESLVRVCDIVYNNFDSMDLIDDGIYDSLAVVYRQVFGSRAHVGGAPVPFYAGPTEPETKIEGYYHPFIEIDPEKAGAPENWLFYPELKQIPPFNPALYAPRDRSIYEENNGKSASIPHNYPKLVGTLEKCKFVMISEAAQYDMLNDPTVKIFERDFLGLHIQTGIIDPNDITLILELKYDGMSVEADVTNEVLGARSRGDTDLDEADDLTVAFKGYKFPNCPEIDQPFGMKFEAIITKSNLMRLAQLRGRSYKNARNAIIGLIKSKDAQAFNDLVTLVPLETSLNVDPITEIQFMNQYYARDVYLNYTVVHGDYNQVMYQVYRFVKEAEAIRDIMPFLYDGIVVHYADPNIRERLGRIGAVNQYSIAIKFNPMRKKTIFRGYTYTVGQDGSITPMAHYDPVEFLGAIHTKSSCHSYRRFLDLNLAIGDVIEVVYVNDVMPYVNKLYTSEYRGEFEGQGTPERFPTHCPFCGTPIVISENGRGDSAFCPNLNCPERRVGIMVNMLSKLSLKGFAESAIRKLELRSFNDFLTMRQDKIIQALGETNGIKFIKMRDEFLATPYPDYRLIGSLGVTRVAIETWKKILSVISFQMLIKSLNSPLTLSEMLKQVKGVGPKTIDTILAELPMFYTDLQAMATLPNIVYTYGADERPIIRWTGVRDAALEERLNAMGYDANSKGTVTKNTTVLVVPYIGYSSSKLSKVSAKTMVVPYEAFAADPEGYIKQAFLAMRG